VCKVGLVRIAGARLIRLITEFVEAVNKANAEEL